MQGSGMTPGQQKIKAAINRAVKHLERRRKDDQASITELSACMRELEEGRQMDFAEPPTAEEDTSPGVPKPVHKPPSRSMPAVTGLEARVDDVLQKGRNR